MRRGANGRPRDECADRRHGADSRAAAAAAEGGVAIAWRGSALASVFLTFQAGDELHEAFEVPHTSMNEA
jgi:hypothetical protein